MANFTHEMEPDIRQSYTHDHLFSILFLVFTTLVGVPGNALVLWVTGVKMKWTMTTIWFWNLALADILCCLIIPFNVAQFFYADWLYGRHFCKILPYIIPVNMFTSVFTLVVISIDRCILVVIPIWARIYRRVKTAWLVCLAVWMLSFLICIPMGIEKTYYNYKNRTLCIIEDFNVEPSTYIQLVFGFLLPFLIIFTCYISIIIKLQNTRHVETGKKITKVALAIIVAFFTTWAPYHIMGVFLMFSEHDVLDAFAIAMAKFNSCINPILYVLMGKEMKSRVRQPIIQRMQHSLGEHIAKAPPHRNDQRMALEGAALQ